MKNKYETSYNLKDRANIIKDVVKSSISDEMGINKGFKLLSINGSKIIDILDYKYLIVDEFLEIEFENLQGETEIYEVEKDQYDDLGLVFETELIDKPKNCHNKCIFCFMEQLPAQVRDTLIFKDDDYRLSFFSGNYITLTNMKQSDIERIIKYRISPINISLHTTDEEIRCMMLNNKNAGKVLKYIDSLYEAKIDMNLQIVLCKDINDKEVLYKTLQDVSKYMPMIKSISIVPVGISKHRDNLYKLLPQTKEDCLDVIQNVSKFQKEFKEEFGTNLVYLSDEFYIKAEIDIPEYKEYEDFAQLENGVGMIAVFEDEFNKDILKLKKKILKQIRVNNINNKTNIILLTGKITYNFIKQKAKILEEILCNVNIDVRYVENNYFGTNITVTGLMTGNDILETIKNAHNSAVIVIPDVCLKEDEEIFLDDVTLEDLKSKFNNIVISENSAKGFIDVICNISINIK
ncbi:MAG: DUF512 domain-containing protein [Clostridia bacterium]|nr:DUF512 domain-containing protein [Clostridia bacterium]MDD4386721.1 DUF512 domain-containing protein [Clostridia bacterium]